MNRDSVDNCRVLLIFLGWCVYVASAIIIPLAIFVPVFPLSFGGLVAVVSSGVIGGTVLHALAQILAALLAIEDHARQVARDLGRR